MRIPFISSAILAMLCFTSCTALAASDQVLRAAYCLKVLDGEIAQEKVTAQSADNLIRESLRSYQAISRQRPLTVEEQKMYFALNDAARESATIGPKLKQTMQANRSRLAAYLMGSYGNVFTRGLSDDFGVLAGALADVNAIKFAFQRGELDVAQCNSEQMSGTRPAVFCFGPADAAQTSPASKAVR